MFLFNFIVVDAHHSILYSCIKEVFDFFIDWDGRTWLIHQIPENPWVVQSVLVDVHQIIHQFLISVSMNHTVLQLVLNKDDIPASNTHDTARKFATVIINNLQSGPAIGHNPTYNLPIASYEWFRSTPTLTISNNTNQTGGATRPNPALNISRGNARLWYWR